MKNIFSARFPRVLERCIIFTIAAVALNMVTVKRVIADDCVRQVSAVIGEFVNSADVHTFNTLESIDSIISVEVDPAGWRYRGNTYAYVCPESHYFYNRNIFTVSNGYTYTQCRATFTVEGLEAGCTPTTGVIGDGNVAQAPLFLSQSAEPNVMYILDDSGSMHFEIMPDSLIEDTARYIFPRASGVYGGSDYDNRVPTVDDNSAYNAMTRSNYFNKIYYDPSVTYRPWAKSDGTSYPDATPSCAYHNPERTGGSGIQYCRNLAANNSDINSSNNSNNTRWIEGNCNNNCTTTSDKTFWPATYFEYAGGNEWNRNNYTKVEIKSGYLYTNGGRDLRTDCADRELAQCTYAEEIQNFANWYTYYRSRILAARAGSGFAFSQQSSNMRVGFATLNEGNSSVDGVNASSIVTGVRAFEDDDRDDFYDNLYGRTIPNSGTPLRAALNSAGEYFSRTDDRGPWSATPGEDNDTTDHLECRRNFSVLVTDGYWSGSDVSGGPGNNNDGNDGPTHTRSVGDSYTYNDVSPFTDGRSDTLADVAMYYWKNDIRDDLDNVINETNDNPAFWQHMVTYGVGFGVSGTVDPDDAFAAISSGANISWPNPTSDEVHKIDDLLHAAVNSRGGFFSAAEPDVFANELASVLQEIGRESKASASSIAVNSTRLDSGTLVYQASFNSNDWSGRLQAYTLSESGAIDSVFWDTNTAGKIPAYGSRNIVAGVGDQGELITDAVDFTVANWDDFTASQQAYLKLSGDGDTQAQRRLAWLAGDRSRESNDLRERTHLLGDIVNSDPFYVGSVENYSYHLLPSTEGSSYAAFLSTKASRDPMLYVGANDGMLHGFNAETGAETFAYIPVSAFPKIAAISDPNYVHSYTVDGSPRVNDAYLSNTWKTVLLGSTGAGGRSVFAIDVTDPDDLDADSIMWEFSTSSLPISVSVGSVLDPLDLSLHRLGVAMSAPVIARVKAGNKWVAIFGNGYDSGDTVKLFVVDLASGSLLSVIDTLKPGLNNGLATVVPVDYDGDRITDYVYAGDLEGNLWKFDFTGSTVASWGFSANFLTTVAGSFVPVPLFTAVDSSNVAQPITARPTVGRHYSSGLMIYFGTGKYFETGDAAIGNNPQVQDFYGIHDTNSPVAKADLASQTVQAQGVMTTLDGSDTTSRVRVTSDNSEQSGGWHLRLLGPSPASADGERVVSPAVLRNGRIIFATITPDESICGYGGSSWLMELDAMTGGRIGDEAPTLDDDGNIINGGVDSPALDINGDGLVNYLDVIEDDDDDSYPPSGVGSDEMIKTPGIIGAGELEYKYTSGTSGSIGVITESAGDESQAGRQSWRQLQ
ncbi:Type IV pilus biogenesis factor PilY1 [Zhongshania aliphaticivorans]|uniref:Type IV pilus biogenesis factor PilY1 n=1 Tax=Zhongshania aliphaticivorans TaxID=1470434 RepID=A0A5S9PWH9_9GAMM|nr:PilC/PilY family type IV pilus protein [Zhongshania aliphaticivorans]CAA0109382.1 Type IV pilus biogenesis factor PilY1 [Zhongshania aliphaticivorans]CAA0117607.1 Type IV pilus biogenesis factor PilY1 [Zhongshania aliphaticivorans]